MELTVDHWFYLYIPWFLPFLLIALLGRGVVPLGETGRRIWSIPASEAVVADLDRGAHHPDVLLGGVEADRHLRHECLQRLLALARRSRRPASRSCPTSAM